MFWRLATVTSQGKLSLLATPPRADALRPCEASASHASKTIIATTRLNFSVPEGKRSFLRGRSEWVKSGKGPNCKTLSTESAKGVQLL